MELDLCAVAGRVEGECILQKPVSSPTVKQLASWLKEADRATGLLEVSIMGLVFMIATDGRPTRELVVSRRTAGADVEMSSSPASNCASLQHVGVDSHVMAHDWVMYVESRTRVQSILAVPVLVHVVPRVCGTAQENRTDYRRGSSTRS
jgi:hypothetical protein